MRIVVGTYDGLLYGWDGSISKNSEGKKQVKLKLNYGYTAHSACIKSVALMAAKKGNTLTTGGADEVIKIYNVQKRVEVGTLMQHTGSITCMSYFGSTHMLSGSADNSICIWRTSDWNCLHIMGGHKGEVNSIAIHPSGKLALSVARDRTLRMWNLVKGRSAFIRRLDEEATVVFLSKDGSKYGLVMGKKIVLFNAGDGEILATITCPKKVNSAAFVNDEYIVSGGEDKELSIWTVHGELLRTVSSPSLTSRIRVLEVVPAEDDEFPFIVVATSTGAVQVWDAADLLAAKDSGEEEVSFSPLAETKTNGGSRVTCLSSCATF